MAATQKNAGLSDGSVTGWSLERRYHTWTWCIFCVLVIVLACFEIVIFSVAEKMTVRVGSLHPLHALLNGLKALEAKYLAFTAATAQTAAPGAAVLSGRLLREFLASFNDFRAQYLVIKDVGAKVNRLQTAATMGALFIVVGTAILVFVYRKLPAVRSRGYLYLVQSFGSAILAIISMHTLVWVQGLPTMPETVPSILDYQKFNDSFLFYGYQVEDIVMVAAVFGVFFVCLQVSAVIQRQRMIYLIHTKIHIDNSFVNHYLFLVWHVPFLAIISMSGYIYKHATSGIMNSRTKEALPIYLIILVYAILLTFYSTKSRRAHYKWADFHANMRTIAVGILAFGVTITLTYVFPATNFSSTGWLGATRFWTCLITLDNLSCQLVQVVLAVRDAETAKLEGKPVTMGQLNERNLVETVVPSKMFTLELAHKRGPADYLGDHSDDMVVVVDRTSNLPQSSDDFLLKKEKAGSVMPKTRSEQSTSMSVDSTSSFPQNSDEFLLKKTNVGSVMPKNPSEPLTSISIDDYC